eukprot:2561109-Rhodomonas_salina.1
MLCFCGLDCTAAMFWSRRDDAATAFVIAASLPVSRVTRVVVGVRATTVLLLVPVSASSSPVVLNYSRYLCKTWYYSKK